MLYVFGNPEPLRSSFSQELRRHAQRSEASILLLSDHLKDGHFPPLQCKLQLNEADSIVIHAPVYWYGAPALVKAWMDQILTPGWAFPSHESKLLRQIHCNEPNSWRSSGHVSARKIQSTYP